MVSISRDSFLGDINNSLESGISEDVVRYGDTKGGGGKKGEKETERIFHYEEADIHCTTPETDQELLEIFGSSGCSSVIAFGEEEELNDEMVTHVIRRSSRRFSLDAMNSDDCGGPLWSEVLREKVKSQDNVKQALPSMAAKSETSSKNENLKKSETKKSAEPKLAISITSVKALKPPPRRPPIPVAPNSSWIEVKRKSQTRSSDSKQRQTQPKPQTILLSNPRKSSSKQSTAPPPKPEMVKPKPGRSPRPRAAKNRDKPYAPRTTITNVFDEISTPPQPKQPTFTSYALLPSIFLATFACLTIAPCL